MPDYDMDDEEWIEDEGDPDDVLLACPACRQLVHEDAQQCPHCGDWITPVDPTQRSKRLLWLLVALALVASMVLTAVL